MRMPGARGSNFDIALRPGDKTSRLLQSVICDSHDLWPIGTNVAITKQKKMTSNTNIKNKTMENMAYSARLETLDRH